MIRTQWLAAMVALLATGSGTGRALADEPPRAGGLRTLGAFGGGQADEGRKVRIEMEGGQTLEGLINSQPFIVEGDLGRYTIWAEKIRSIQFLKRSNVEEEPEPPAQAARRRAQAQAMGMGMMGGGMRPQQPTLVRGKVTTTTGKVIVGDIHIPPNFSLTLDFGTLAVAPEKLRTLTMIGAEDDQPAQPEQPQNPPGARPNNTDGPQSQGNPRKNPSGIKPDNGSNRPDKP